MSVWEHVRVRAQSGVPGQPVSGERAGAESDGAFGRTALSHQRQYDQLPGCGDGEYRERFYGWRGLIGAHKFLSRHQTFQVPAVTRRVHQSAVLGWSNGLITAVNMAGMKLDQQGAGFVIVLERMQVGAIDPDRQRFLESIWHNQGRGGTTRWFVSIQHWPIGPGVR